MQAMTNGEDASHEQPTGQQYRTAAMPAEPEPVAGEPVVEYLTVRDLKARGWSADGIRECLGPPDGTREVSGSVYDFNRGWFDSYMRTRDFYRLDRVLAAEQAGDVRSGLAPGWPRPSPDPRPLALTLPQLRRRGWSTGLLAEFMPAPDGHHVSWFSGRRVPHYAVARVEQAESKPGFMALWALVERRRVAGARARHAEAEARRAKEAVAAGCVEYRAAAKKAALEAAFPGFVVTVILSGSAGVHVGIAFAGGPATSTHAKGSEVRAFAHDGEMTGTWGPLVDWLVAREEVGNARFRRALLFLAAGNPEGWRAWHAGWESRAEERRAAGVEYGRRCKERQLEVARCILGLPEDERFAAWRSRTGRGRMALNRRLAELAAGETQAPQQTVGATKHTG